MTIYYYGDKKPEGAPSWARPIDEAYEGKPKYKPQQHKAKAKIKPTKLEKSLLFT
ncbi:hypothetical protein KY343_01030 [Candidatus Woesearchaeota archaeon]|nr:hypothetical protein [Candidatus Woesearchaeota archaeon]